MKRARRGLSARAVALVSAVGCALCILAWGATLKAQPVLRWTAPARCPQARAVSERMTQLLPGAHGFVAEGQVAGSAERGFVLTLHLTLSSGSSARRVLSSRNCTELTSAATWLIALAVDPERVRAAQTTQSFSSELVRAAPPESEPARTTTTDATLANSGSAALSAAEASDLRGSRSLEPASSIQAAPSPIEAPALRVDTEVSRRPPRSKRFRVGGFGGLFSGAATRAQGTLGAWADIAVGAFHSQLRVSEIFPSSIKVDAGHVNVTSVELAISECAMWGARVLVGPCAGVDGIRTAAHSRDFGHDTQRALYWAVAQLGLQLLWPVHKSVELAFAGEAGLPITPRPRFTVEGVGPVAVASRWSGDARIGLTFVSR